MKKKTFFKPTPTDIKIGCMDGDCEGICKELHFKACPCKYQYYMALDGKKYREIYIDESITRW